MMTELLTEIIILDLFYFCLGYSVRVFDHQVICPPILVVTTWKVWGSFVNFIFFDTALLVCVAYWSNKLSLVRRHEITVGPKNHYSTIQHIPFNTKTPTNIKNLFDNLLHCVRKMIKLKSGWEFVLYCPLYGMFKIILCLTNQELRPLAGHTYLSLLPGSVVVMSLVRGQAKSYGFCVQTAEIGGTRFVHPDGSHVNP